LLPGVRKKNVGARFADASALKSAPATTSAATSFTRTAP
jgi:hypothetical protein